MSAGLTHAEAFELFDLTPAEWYIIESEWAEDDLVSFIKLYYRGYRPAWYHFLIADELRKVSDKETLRLMLIMPPRHGKSTLVSRYFPAWHLGRYPDDRIIATSYASRLAHRFGRFNRNLVADDRYPFEGIELARDSRAAEVWDIMGHQGGYIAAGLDGSITGEGAHVLLIDDPVKSAKEADSETVRETTIEWYTETAYPRLQANGAIVVVGTRWRDDDLLGYILEQSETGQGDEYKVIKFPAINADGEALWPDEYPVPELEKRRLNMTKRMWAAQYQGEPQTDEGSILKRWYWRFWYPRGKPLPPVEVKGPKGTMVRIEPEELPTFFDKKLQSWDMAFEDAENNSWVVGQVWYKRHENRYLIDQFRAHVDMVGSALAVKTMTALNPDVHRKLIEKKANGPAVISYLRTQVGGMIPINPEGSKESRVWATQPYAEGGNIFLPHPLIAPWVLDLIDECAKFPVGSDDDQVDALTQANIDFSTLGSAKTTATSYAGGGTNGRSNGHNGPWAAEEDEYE